MESKYYPDRVCGCGCDGRIKVRLYHSWYGIPNYLPSHNSCKIPRENRTCAFSSCNNTFEVGIYSVQKYCSIECAGKAKRGVSKSKEMRKALQDAKIGRNYEEVFGDRAVEERRKRGDFSRNKTYEELYGDQAEEQRESRRVGNRGKHSYLVAGKGPNIPEKFLIKLLQELFPNQWKFVGDGSFWLTSNGKHLNPDFIHVNQKKIIEHFGDFHHGEGRTGVPNEQHERERIDLFAQLGYQTLVIWQYQLSDEKLLKNKITNLIR